MDVFFSEPVIPLDLSSLKASGASVQSVERVNAEHSRFLLEGHIGAEARLSLSSYEDFAGNRGA